jgi:trk system potassium uptake protein TrkH
LLPLAMLGGLGLPVLIELSNWVFGKNELSRNSRVVLKLTAIAYLGGFVLLMLGQLSAARSGGWAAWRSTLASCTSMAVNARTAGIPVQSPAAFTAAGQWILMALMGVGASSAGTAGGIKLTTVWHLVRGTRDLLGGKAPQRMCGIAIVWIGFYGIALFVGMVLLAACESAAASDRLLFMAISALSNVGLSHDPISMTGPGLIVMSGLMLVGRVAPLAVLWWTATIVDEVDVVVG